MNASLARPDAQAHRSAQELLPWLAAGQLTAEQAALLERHLRGCDACRRDAELERCLRAATSVAVPAGPTAPAGGAVPGLDDARQPDMEAALARLLPQLDGHAPATPAMPATAAPARPRFPARWRALLARRARWPRWTRWAQGARWTPLALAAQFAVIAGLAILLAERPAAPPYRLLGDADGAGANLVVVFKPDTAEKELRRLLRANQARVVGGPTVTDAYLLAVPEPQRARARLRAEAAVVLAEPLAAGESP